jgi:hypothetical protein
MRSGDTQLSYGMGDVGMKVNRVRAKSGTGSYLPSFEDDNNHIPLYVCSTIIMVSTMNGD